MTNILLPPWLCSARVQWRYIDSTGVSTSEFTGAIVTGSRGGDRLGATLEFVPTNSRTRPVERAALRTFLARLRGRQNRAYLYDPGYQIRGGFPAQELLTNNTFESGTPGWSSLGDTVGNVVDRIYRATATAVIASSTDLLQSANTAVTQYAPHVARIMILPSLYTALPNVRIRDGDGLNLFTSGGFPHADLHTFQFVPHVNTVRVSISDTGQQVAKSVAGQYLDISYTSLSRCLLVDNGQNLLLQSDEFDTSWTATRASVDDQATAAPDGSSTAYSLIEDSTSNDTHFVRQDVSVAAAEADYSFAIALKAGTRAWANIMLVEGTGSSAAEQYVNLDSGVLGSSSVGENWANQRGFIAPLGSGWYYVCIVARKTNAATTVGVRIRLATADDPGDTYNGDGTSNIYAWRATLAQSSVPTRLVQTTSAATTGTAQTGSALHVKGGPPNLQNALLPGDMVEIVTSRGPELKIVTAALDFDDAGLGYLQFEPPIRFSPADNAPVIVHQPMGRFVFTGDLVGWQDEPGIITRASAEFEEA